MCYSDYWTLFGTHVNEFLIVRLKSGTHQPNHYTLLIISYWQYDHYLNDKFKEKASINLFRSIDTFVLDLNRKENKGGWCFMILSVESVSDYCIYKDFYVMVTCTCSQNGVQLPCIKIKYSTGASLLIMNHIKTTEKSKATRKGEKFCEVHKPSCKELYKHIHHKTLCNASVAAHTEIYMVLQQVNLGTDKC